MSSPGPTSTTARLAAVDSMAHRAYSLPVACRRTSPDRAACVG